MRIVTYTCNDEVPAGSEAVARLLEATKVKGRTVERQMPIIIYGSTAEEARANAQAWWEAQQARERRKLANAQAAGERLAQSRKAKAEPAASGLHTLNKRKAA